MIKEVKSIADANICDQLLTKLIQDERKYNDTIDENYIVVNHFNKILNNKDIVLLAYYLKEEIVGYILIRKTSDKTCLLDGLFVLENYRNRGIANELLTEAIKICKKLEVKYVDINVMAKNEVARHIYEKLGFSTYEIKLRKNV